MLKNNIFVNENDSFCNSIFFTLNLLLILRRNTFCLAIKPTINLPQIFDILQLSNTTPHVSIAARPIFLTVLFSYNASIPSLSHPPICVFLYNYTT